MQYFPLMQYFSLYVIKLTIRCSLAPGNHQEIGSQSFGHDAVKKSARETSSNMRNDMQLTAE